MACGTICRVEIQAIKTQQRCLSQSERRGFPCRAAIAAHGGAAAADAAGFRICFDKMLRRCPSWQRDGGSLFGCKWEEGWIFCWRPAPGEQHGFQRSSEIASLSHQSATDASSVFPMLHFTASIGSFKNFKLTHWNLFSAKVMVNRYLQGKGGNKVLCYCTHLYF